MEIIIINKQEDINAFKNEKKRVIEFNGNVKINTNLIIEAGWSIEAEGYIKAGWSIEAEGYIEAGGCIEAEGYIKAGGYIEAGWYIKAKEYIEAEWYIKAEGYIKAGGYIKAKEYIKAGGYIEAEWYIKAEEYIFSFKFKIKSKKIITKTLPFWREFWAEMTPLVKFRSYIKNDSNCWDALKIIPTQTEVVEICEWEGWHWILKGHLECFFGIRESFSAPGIE